MYRSILVPVDGSAPSRAALAEALRLAKEQGARVRLAYVVEPVRHVVAEGVVDLTTAARREGEMILEQAAQEARAAGVEAQTALVEAADRRVPEAIVEEAAAAGADLIAMGTHGRRGIEHLLVGSVAEGVVRRSRVPVLLIRGK
ncbi:MAG TPA: universal stress protein [Burkholderiales bacterium]|nr:universal stress protein [Burkholderiales bacterium]